MNESLIKTSKNSGMKIADDLKFTMIPIKQTPGVGDYCLTSRIPTVDEFKWLLK